MAARVLGAQSPDELAPLVGPEKRSCGGLFSARLITCVTSIAEGYAIGVMSGAHSLVEEDLGLSQMQVAWLVGIANAAIAVGAPLGGALADGIGRVSALAVGYVLIITGACQMAFATSYGTLMTGRVIEAVGVGLGLSVVTTYMAEVAPRGIRGQLPSLEEFFLVVGILFGFISNYVLLDVQNNWRWMLGLGGLIPTIFVTPILFGFLPESPRYLAMHGMEEEAHASLAAFVQEHERQEVIESWSKMSDADVRSWAQVLCPASRVEQKALVCSVFVMFMQMFSGVPIVVMYMGPYFADTMPKKRAYLFAMLVMVWRCVVALPATFGIDSVGRRRLLLQSLAGMAAASVVTTALMSSGAALFPWQVLGFVAFFTAYSVGSGPVTWVFCSEVLPTAARSKGVALAVFVARVYASAILVVSYSFLDVYGMAPMFAVFAVTNVLGFAFAWARLPETNNTHLESMHTCFAED